MAKKRLGIDVLFNKTSVPSAVPTLPTPDATTAELAVTVLRPSSHQPRSHFEPVALTELADSIRAHGVLQPILVRALDEPGQYEIVAGERRWRAAEMAGLERVPVRVLAIADREMLSVAMVENLQREDLNPLEEAEGYLELLRIRLEDDPGFAAYRDDVDPTGGVIRLLRALNNRLAGNIKDNAVLTLEPVVAEVFSSVGTLTWQSFHAHRLPLLSLQDDVRAALRSGIIPYTKARFIARVTADRLNGDEPKARKIRSELIARASSGKLSVRELQKHLIALFGEEKPDVKPAPPSGEALAVRLTELRQRLEHVDAARLSAERRSALSAAIESVIEQLED